MSNRREAARGLLFQLEDATGCPAHRFYPSPQDSKKVRGLNMRACDVAHTDRIAVAWSRLFALADAANGHAAEVMVAGWKRGYQSKSAYTSFDYIRVGGGLHSTPQHSGRATFA